MKKSVKVWLVLAISFLIIGCIMFCGVMSELEWDFRKLSTVRYETNEYTITENYKNISVHTNTADIKFVILKNAKTSVVCYEQEKLNHSVEVKDGTLTISIVDTRKWYDYIGINFGSPKITIYIPEGEYGELSVKASTGNVAIPKELKFGNIDIAVSTGNVINYASALKDVKIKTSTGNITASGLNCDNIELKVSTGKTSIADISCESLKSSGSTGGIILKNVKATDDFSINRSTGNVHFEDCDASEIFVETDTGDVKGSLLSSKIFITETDTGSINVPKTVTGGKCEIVTDTGNINIKIKE